jgi:uncharacterized phage protein (TIGR01671 family)
VHAGNTIFNTDGGERVQRAPIDGSIIQYTGLKDKNGVKIFEGDIIKAKELIFKVCFGNYYVISVNNVGFYLEWKYKSKYSMLDNRFYSSAQRSKIELEVIGNIHENPELLEVSNERD